MQNQRMMKDFVRVLVSAVSQVLPPEQQNMILHKVFHSLAANKGSNSTTEDPPAKPNGPLSGKSN